MTQWDNFKILLLSSNSLPALSLFPVFYNTDFFPVNKSPNPSALHKRTLSPTPVEGFPLTKMPASSLEPTRALKFFRPYRTGWLKILPLKSLHYYHPRSTHFCGHIESFHFWYVTTGLMQERKTINREQAQFHRALHSIVEKRLLPPPVLQVTGSFFVTSPRKITHHTGS